MSRRIAWSTLLGVVFLALGQASGAPPAVLPFCRFSLVDGWTANPVEYIARKAGPKDRSGVPQVVEEIKRALKARASLDVYIAKDENNAFATVAKGRKILVVDVGFLEKLNQMTGTEWSAIQVIAHEVGHHIAGFSEDRHRSELSADYWSGQILQRLGANKSAATSAILTVGTPMDTPTHPNKQRRRLAIEKGWEDSAAGETDYSFCLDCR